MTAADADPTNGFTHDGFTHDGRGLDHWLWELVCADIRRREVAVDALARMRFDAPTTRADEPSDNMLFRRDAFGAAVRRALSEPGADGRPGTDGPRYVRRLAAFLREAQAERMGLWKQENARTDRVTDRIAVGLRADGLSDGRRRTLHRRLGRVIGSVCDPRNVAGRAQDMLLSQQVKAGFVFAALGPLVLAAPDVVRDMLRDPQEAWHAAGVIEALGPRAAVFADDLFELLASDDGFHDSQLVKALAAVVRDDAGRVAQLVTGVADRRDAVAVGAANTLGWVGPRAAELVPETVPALLARATADGPFQCSMIVALGKVARGNDGVVAPLLALSRHADVWVRGAALTALGDVNRRPELVVPRLVEAFADYAEPNPDYTYGSAHERVVEALRQFGPDAARAVPALVARVRRDEGGETDTGVIKTLGAIGPAAAAALPALEALAADDEAFDADAPDEVDPLAAAVRRIRGR